MVTCVCAPSITAEMNDWVKLGGGNSGCCGNAAHTYGFHLAGGNVSTSDYSRRHEVGKPYDLSWACAGDFSHRNNAALRAMHLTVLNRLLSNDPALSMICEFIGSPWADKGAYYWCRWENKLKKYTGSGHDHWSHISWWRSRANERAYLWVPQGATPTIPVSVPTSTAASYPKYPGYVITYNPKKYDANLKVWQTRMRQRGWNLGPAGADGVYGPALKKVVLAFQKEKGLQADAEIGPKTWAAAWTAPVTK